MSDFIDFIRSYSLQDFMPMGPDAYLRLFERLNASFWPWHILTLATGIAVLILLLRGREKIAWPLLGCIWVLVGLKFHAQYFAELNWAAVYIAWAFLAQGLLLLLMFFRALPKPTLGKLKYSQWVGAALIGVSVLIYPFLSLLSNHGWQSTQVFGVSPDPTCLFTLGAILLSRQKAWWLMPLPLLWCAISAAIAYALYLPSGLILLSLGLIFLITRVLDRRE